MMSEPPKNASTVTFAAFGSRLPRAASLSAILKIHLEQSAVSPQSALSHLRRQSFASSFAPVLLSANWYFDESFLMILAVSSSKPWCSNGAVEVGVSASGISVLTEEESSAADDKMIPPDQEVLGKISMMINLLSPAQESSMFFGNLEARVVRVAPEWAVGTRGAITIVNLFLGEGNIVVGHYH